MDLDTARGLKQELWSLVERARVRTGSGQSERKPELALGFAATPTYGDVTIAVRAESEEELPEFLADQMRRETDNQIDVRYTGEIKPLVGPCTTGVARPLAIGVSIAHWRCGAGTLGFFARRTSDGAIGIVSNNHVIGASDHGADHDEILQPAPDDHGTRIRDVVAYLSADYPRLRQTTAVVDCAFAPLAPGIQYDPAPNGTTLSPLLAAASGELKDVCKVGRTTGVTYGRVTAFELDKVRVTYPFGRIVFNGQIEIDPAQGVPFSRPGDSGSLVFTYPDHQPLGLIFGCSLRGGTADVGLTFANPIHTVLAALGVTLIT